MIKTHIEYVIAKINWQQLREHKHDLACQMHKVGIDTGWIEYLLNLLDHLQDAAVADGIATAEEVLNILPE